MPLKTRVWVPTAASADTACRMAPANNIDGTIAATTSDHMSREHQRLDARQV